MSQIEVFYESTPNPNSMKFQVTSQIAEESLQIQKDDPKANRSPLAIKLFGFPWAKEIFIGPTFVTVTKEDWVDWQILAQPLSKLIQEHLEQGEPVLVQAPTVTETEDTSNDSEIVQKIKTVLNHEIRPAVAMDGGDIVFAGFEDGILQLQMQGACSGCPSSAITLKEGIETRMRDLFPEVKEVVAV